MFIEPLLQRQIIGQTAKQRHGQMGMGIDQARHDNAPSGIEGLCGSGQPLIGRRRPNLFDLALLDGDSTFGDHRKVLVHR